MLARVTICGIVLIGLLWIEDAQAGSSFLSPAEMQKNSGKRPPKTMVNRDVHRRGTEDDLDTALDQLPEDKGRFGFTFPLDINLKITEDQFYQQKETIEEILSGILSLGSSQRKHEK